MRRIIELKPDVATRALFLHKEAFSDSACVTCKGACCALCGSAQGYLEYSVSRQELGELKAKYGYDRKTGFQGPEGCKLPVSERSLTCIGFMCSGVSSSRSAGWPVAGTNKPFTKEQRTSRNEMVELLYGNGNYKNDPTQTRHRTGMAGSPC